MRFFSLLIPFIGGLAMISCAHAPPAVSGSVHAHPGVQHFLENASDYSVFIGVGNDVYPITSARMDGDTLHFAYPAYNDGREKGYVNEDGLFIGTFTTDVSAGTVRIQFNNDGTATGAWLLNDHWIEFYGTNKTVLGMGYGPNNIKR